LDIGESLTHFDLDTIKDVFSIIGIVATVVLGTIGLFTWKRQLRGTSEYELAKKAVFLTYEIDQLVNNVRNPMLYLSKEEVEAGRRIEEELRIYNDRLQELFNKWTELQLVRLEAKVVWSTAAHDCFDDIKDCIGDLKAAIWLHFWMKGAYAGSGTQVDNNPGRVADNDKVIYFLSEDDEFSKKVKGSVKKIEDYFIDKVRS